MNRTMVIALGGNALGHTPEAQRAAVRMAAGLVAELVRTGDRIVLTHGNGPQVGIIHLAFDLANAADPQIPAMPFAESTAMSQGYIGWHLQGALQDAFRERGIGRSVATVVTQVIVDAADPAFRHPCKPVGADRLVILTTVPFAARDYRTPAQRWIPRMTVSEARRFCTEGHFAEGSMLPKVQAGIGFTESGHGREAVIAFLGDARKAVRGAAGTRIVPD